MKQSASIAVAALLGLSSAAKVAQKEPVRPLQYHWNEDPNSVPDPLFGASQMSSTKAKYWRLKQNEEASEQKGSPALFGNDHHTAPNAHDERFYFV